MPISFSGNYYVDQVIDFLAVSFFFASQLICPVCAFSLRRSILSVAKSTRLRILAFSLIAGAQIILVGIFYTVAEVNAGIQYRQNQKAQLLRDEERRVTLDQLTSSNVEVSASDVEITTDDGFVAVANVHLEIRNMPQVVQYFDFALPVPANDHEISYSFHNFPSLPNRNCSIIRGRQINQKWIFYKGLSDEIISDDSTNIPVQIEIRNLKPSAQQFSTSISPSLTVWRDEERETVFWNKPIPIKIRRF